MENEEKKIEDFPALNPIDRLSYSPSLVDILAHCNFNDLGRCRLTSRRFCDVIMRNLNQMPRQCAEIIIEKRVEGDADHVYMNYSKNREGKISRARFDLCQNYASASIANMDIINDLYNVVKGSPHKTAESVSCSIEERIRQMLKPLLLRYQCSLAIFLDSSDNGNVPLSWFTTILKVAKSCLTDFSSISLPLRSDLVAAASCFNRGPRHIRMVSRSCDKISSVLPLFFKSHWRRITLTIKKTDDFVPRVAELISRWKSGDYRIPLFSVVYHLDDWPTEKIEDVVLQLEPIIDSELFGDRSAFNRFIARSSDDRVLHISHKKGSLQMYDIIPRNSYERFQFNHALFN